MSLLIMCSNFFNGKATFGIESCEYLKWQNQTLQLKINWSAEIPWEEIIENFKQQNSTQYIAFSTI